jgi:hypothetical protein
MDREAIQLWVTVVSGLGALLLLAGAMIAAIHPSMLSAPNEAVTSGLRVMAGYVVARNAALGALLQVALLRRERTALRTLLFLYGVVQLLDAVMDGIEGRWVIVPGVLVLAALMLATAAGLRVRPAD